jgi:hypothetical protein
MYSPAPSYSNQPQLSPAPVSAFSNKAASPDPSTGIGPRAVSGGALPGLPSSFPELEQLTAIQLQRLLSDQVALEVKQFCASGFLCEIIAA